MTEHHLQQLAAIGAFNYLDQRSDHYETMGMGIAWRSSLECHQLVLLLAHLSKTQPHEAYKIMGLHVQCFLQPFPPLMFENRLQRGHLEELTWQSSLQELVAFLGMRFGPRNFDNLRMTRETRREPFLPALSEKVLHDMTLGNLHQWGCELAIIDVEGDRDYFCVSLCRRALARAGSDEEDWTDATASDVSSPGSASAAMEDALPSHAAE